MSAAGDINGDGIADLIIGAMARTLRSELRGVWEGAAVAGAFPANLELSTLDGANGFKLSGAADDHSGNSVSGAGDINGDGIEDLLVGAPEAYPFTVNSGASYVVFGKNTATAGAFPANLNLANLNGTTGFKLSGVRYSDYSGFSVSAAGDINGDGVADLIIGAVGADPNGLSSGASYVVFGERFDAPDADDDGISDKFDNCPTVANPDQRTRTGMA